MTKRLITLMAALLVLGFAVTGCGDDEGSDSGSAGTAAETATGTVTDDETATGEEPATDTDTVTDETVTEEGGGASAPTNLGETVENCKKGVGAARQLSADAREELQEICEKATTGDRDDVRDAARKVCETIIEDTFPEDSPAREQALASCRSAGGR